MRTLASRIPAVVAAVATLTFGWSARADLPPPKGTKFVNFAFSVDNAGAFKDFALVAYPCGTSWGTPTAELAELKDGASVSVGRRGGNCRLYGVPRADLDAWRATKSNDYDALVKAPKARECKGGPTLNFVLPTSDPRSTASEVLHIAQLDASGCTVTSGASASTPSTATTPSVPGPPPTPSQDPTAAPPQVSRGCAGCTTTPRDGAHDLGIVGTALAVVIADLMRRRRRA